MKAIPHTVGDGLARPEICRCLKDGVGMPTPPEPILARHSNKTTPPNAQAPGGG
ncbi:MAG: hypothetical protein FWH05_02695 [Oscillospiraceae bacterium]|nr:hypothetical protein [Oscillospiraceae bacterium]